MTALNNFNLSSSYELSSVKLPKLLLTSWPELGTAQPQLVILHFQIVSTSSKRYGKSTVVLTYRFPDESSIFAKCCTFLYPHFDMVHLFHSTVRNGGSYMSTLNTRDWRGLRTRDLPWKKFQPHLASKMFLRFSSFEDKNIPVISVILLWFPTIEHLNWSKLYKLCTWQIINLIINTDLDSIRFGLYFHQRKTTESRKIRR